MKGNDYKEITRERIIELIEEFCPDTNRKQQAFADMCGVSKFSISQYVNGTNAPGNITAAKIANKCNVDPLWVMGFDVPKHPVGKNKQQKYYLNDEDAKIIEAMATNPNLRALYHLQRDFNKDEIAAFYNMALTIKRKDERLDEDDPC